MAKRKLLARMNQRGNEVEVTGIDPDTGKQVTETVWLQKVSGPDHQAVMAKADAARARIIAAFRDREGDDWMAMYQAAVDLGDDVTPLLDMLVAAKVAERVAKLQAEHAQDEESPWAKENYLSGLHDAWEGSDDEPGLKEVFAASEDGDESFSPDLVAEARRVFEELKRFDEELSALIDQEKDDARRYYETDDIDELRVKVTERMATDAGDAAWVAEMTLARVFYGTRELKDRSKRYFDSYGDLKNADAAVKGQLIRAYREFSLEPLEGKGSRPAPSSSDSSEQPATPADSGSSGRQTAVV